MMQTGAHHSLGCRPKGSPKVSPRHSLGFSASRTVHPLLKLCNAPPDTHPMLHRISRKSLRQYFGDCDGGNNLEGGELRMHASHA